MKKRYMGVDLHRNCFTVYTRMEDGSGESREWAIRDRKAFAETVKASDAVAVEAKSGFENSSGYPSATLEHARGCTVTMPSYLAITEAKA